MNISKNTISFLVKKAFEKNDKDIIIPFVETYNYFFGNERIYDITECGKFGLQGFICEGKGLDLTDIGHIYEDYKRNMERNTYFFFDFDNGDATRLVNDLDHIINKLCDHDSARLMFIKKIGFYNIMDTTNSHSATLVNTINEIWVCGDKKLWAQILYAIAVRDEQELKDKGIIVNDKQDAYDSADLILMRVCDDEDLEMIIHYFKRW